MAVDLQLSPTFSVLSFMVFHDSIIAERRSRFYVWQYSDIGIGTDLMKLAKLQTRDGSIDLVLDLESTIVCIRRADLHDDLLAPFSKFGDDRLKFKFVLGSWHMATFSSKGPYGIGSRPLRE